MHSCLKISIITVCYNAESCIEKAIQSVIDQTYKNFEYIVIDGQSTDQTLAIVNKYKGNISKIISEKDNGVFDAMNKGVNHSTGDIIYFLNSDDYFYDFNILEKIDQEFLKSPSTDILNGKVVVDTGIKKYDNSAFTSPCKTKKDLFTHGLCHQRVFVKRQLFEKYGLFNTKYKICADFDWLMRVFNSSVEIKFADYFIAHFYPYGFSHKEGNGRIKETLTIVFKNASLIEFLYFCLNNFAKIPKKLFSLYT
jgi:glycosyltransferase involved in cell wall biosynthesis